MSSSEKKLKIIFIGTQMEVAGAQEVLLSQAKWFREKRYETQAVFFYDKQNLLTKWQSLYDFPVFSLNAWGSSPFSFLKFLPGLVKLFFRLKTKVDVVVSFTPHSNLIALPVAWLAGVPVRVGTHHGHIQDSGKLLARLHGWLTNSRFCTAMVAVSRQVYDYALAAENANPTKLHVIENGIESFAIDREGTTAIRSSLGANPDSLLFLTVGRLTEQKGHTILLDAIAQLDSDPLVAFVFAGDGPLRQELESQARRLRIEDKVRFLGVRDDVRELLLASDVFVQPSLWEGLSLALLEALFAGIPVLVTEVEGTVDVVENEKSALLVPAGNGAALAAAIKRLTADKSLRVKLGKAGRLRAEARYSLERMCKEYEKLFLSLN